MLMVSLFFWLLVFLGVAWLVNKARKGPVLNGAALYLALGVVFLVISLINAGRQQGPEAVGAVLANFLLPMLTAAYLASQFGKRKKAGGTQSNEAA